MTIMNVLNICVTAFAHDLRLLDNNTSGNPVAVLSHANLIHLVINTTLNVCHLCVSRKNKHLTDVGTLQLHRQPYTFTS